MIGVWQWCDRLAINPPSVLMRRRCYSCGIFHIIQVSTNDLAVADPKQDGAVASYFHHFVQLWAKFRIEFGPHVVASVHQLVGTDIGSYAMVG